MAKKLDLDAELDRLYGDDPDDFVAGRNELAKQLKADDRGDEAAEVKKLKKPTRPAALVNWLSRERDEDVQALARIADRMRDPKVGADGKKLRAAAAEEREAVDQLLEAAREELKKRGGPKSALERVGETLRAMASDPDVEEQVLKRRLEREQEAATVGFAMEGGVSFTPSRADKEKKQKAKEKPKPKGPDLKKIRAEARAAEKQADRAEARVAEAEQAAADAEAELEQARTALKEAKAEAREARSEAKKATRRLESAED